jgi:hypothetical protein
MKAKSAWGGREAGVGRDATTSRLTTEIVQSTSIDLGKNGFKVQGTSSF